MRGAEALLDAVRACWSSLFGARTIYYRAKRGFGQADMDIAVVVQRQIQSTRSGVMFTIDPSTGDRDRLVIEGAFGLGEAVVSGSVSPDRYVVDKDGLRIDRREVRRKELAIVSAARTAAPRPASSPSDEGRGRSSATRRCARSPSSGVRIERHYGSPQDTEWAFDADGDGLDAAVAAGDDCRRGDGRRASAGERGARAGARPRRRARRSERLGARGLALDRRRRSCRTARSSSPT